MLFLRGNRFAEFIRNELFSFSLNHWNFELYFCSFYNCIKRKVQCSVPEWSISSFITDLPCVFCGFYLYKHYVKCSLPNEQQWQRERGKDEACRQNKEESGKIMSKQNHSSGKERGREGDKKFSCSKFFLKLELFCQFNRAL